MLIVDGQIHLWEKGTPSPQHRQEPYSAEQAIAAMDQDGVDRALIHPVLWDPDSNELAQEAVHKYPNRFAIMGWFYLDDPNGRDLAAERIRVLRVAGLTGRLDPDVGVFGERQQLGLEAIGRFAAAPWRHGHVVDDQFEPGVTLGDLADSRQEQRGGDRHRHASPLGRGP